MSCIDTNQKTYRSFDLTTVCPKKREGNPCPYCYVEDSRRRNFNAKKEIERRHYYNDVLRLKQSTIDKLNRCGGIRMFSFGDYMEDMRYDIQRFLDDCESCGLRVKAITKQPEFVLRFVGHETLYNINVSIDSIGHGMDQDTAIFFRKRYPDKVRVRSVATCYKDIDNLKDISDVITLNHGRNGFHSFGVGERVKLYYDLNEKVCCYTGDCETCALNCGMPNAKSIGGV